MSIFSFFKRMTETAPAPQEAPTAKRKDDRSFMTMKDTEARIREIREGLTFVKRRQGLKTQAEAMQYLVRKYREHVERQWREEGVATIKPAKKPQEVIAGQSAALPPMQPVSLGSKAEVQRRVEVCRKALTIISDGDFAWALRKDWEEALAANERLLILLDSGLSLQNRKAHGVFVDGKHYYRPRGGKARLSGSPDFVLMDVHTFIASVGAAA